MSKFNYLLLFLLIVSLNNVFAQEVETDSSIEEIVVTGSYLKTSPTDGASPIDVIDREEIENFGYFMARARSRGTDGIGKKRSP